jgi:2-dehydro-3-deoxygluconokinase
MTKGIDVTTFGEALIRYSPPDHARLEQARQLDVHVGGSELNTAVAVASLGLSARFVTRLPSNPLGRLIRNKAREFGVDTDFFSWAESERVGTYYVELGASPRPNIVTYDRGHSAMASITFDDVDWTHALLGCRVFHTSGITPALSNAAAKTTLEAIRVAHEAGLLISVDLNYRARLWSESEARDVMTEIVRQADILLTTEEDTARVFGIREASYDDVARHLSSVFDLKAVAITLRDTPTVWRNVWTAIAYDRTRDEIHRAPRFEIDVVDRVGSGDAFAGGFLYGYLTAGVAAGVRYGVGISALKQTVPGDLVYASKDDVERALQGGGLRIVR